MQYNINVANGTGMEVRTNLNLAHQSLATNFFGATDPSLMSPVCAFPGSTWADTGNGLLKVRNADDSDWIVIGTIESDGTPKLNASGINNTPSGTISATNVQSAVNSLNVLPLLLRDTAYADDDVAFYAELPSAMYLQCTTAGTTDTVDITIPSPVAVGDTITDGTVEWTVKKVGDSDLTEYTKTVNSPMFNKRDIIITSGTYTAPVTGWYKITAKGGGGGGGGSRYAGGPPYITLPSGGGGEGGTTIAYERMTAGDTATVTIGAGGTGATADANTATTGGNGGDSSVTINSNTYTAGGGKGGTSYNGEGGAGGTGTIYGACGGTSQKVVFSGTGGNATGGNGGGAGGSIGTTKSDPTDGVNGGGGAGGSIINTTTVKNGTNGGNGYVWFEYYDSSLNP